MDANRLEQRRLRLPVRDTEVLVGGRGRRDPVEQGGELVPRRAGVVAGMTELVQAAPDPGHGPGVVVDMVAEAVLGLEPWNVR
jgi:hypothetical protein